MPYHFDAETIGTLIAPDHWQLTLAPDWNINNNPNGGYILACLLQSMCTLVPENPDPLSVTTHYLRPGLPGKPADITATLVRAGRRTSTVTGVLIQDGKERIVCTATFGTLADANELVPDDARHLTMPPPDLPPPEECSARGDLGQGVELALLSRVDVRVDPKYSAIGTLKDATLAGWIRFNDERPADVLALPLFADAFPPSVFSLYGRIGWVPTLELGVHIRRRPRPGWIKAAFKTQDLSGDLFIEDGLLWDESDRLVAQSRQVQMILS